jgi:hypothetical protein
MPADDFRPYRLSKRRNSNMYGQPCSRAAGVPGAATAVALLQRRSIFSGPVAEPLDCAGAATAVGFRCELLRRARPCSASVTRRSASAAGGA